MSERLAVRELAHHIVSKRTRPFGHVNHLIGIGVLLELMEEEIQTSLDILLKFQDRCHRVRSRGAFAQEIMHLWLACREQVLAGAGYIPDTVPGCLESTGPTAEEVLCHMLVDNRE